MNSAGSKTRLTLMIAAILLFAMVFGCVGEAPDLPKTGNGKKVIVIAFDGLDPELVTKWMDEGVLPNFDHLRKTGTFSELTTSIPPQSPVAWSNFITGKNPGGHGIFDFIHRDPKHYMPYLSTSQTEHTDPDKVVKLFGYKIPTESGKITLLRKGKAFWEYVGEANIPATIFAIPANYPPVEGNFRSLAGMGTPDLLGGYGTFFYYTDNPPPADPDKELTGGKVIPVTVKNHQVKADIVGPKNEFVEVEKGKAPPDSKVPFTAYVDPENDAITVEIGGQRLLLQKGEWSPWTQIEFEMVPVLISVKGMVRFFLKNAHPFELYVSPINIDPRDPAVPITTPPEYAKELTEAAGGNAFHTQGIPEDTKALSGGILDNDEFLEQAWKVLDERMKLYRFELDRYKEGLLFFYFSSSDQIGHMFYREMDPTHPAYDAEKDAKYADVLKTTYMKLDKALGMAIEKAGDDTLLMVMSDHGFAPYGKSFHLSSWLLENNYVTLIDPSDRESDLLLNVEWMGTKAYAFGINGLYLNLSGREAQGIVRPSQADAILDELVEKLEALVDPETGQKIISKVYKTSEVYDGPYKNLAPDLIVGYNRGYRSSWETALGKFPKGPLLKVNKDAWSGDHCMAHFEVPGSFFSNWKAKMAHPALYDLPVTILEELGLPRPSDMIGHNVLTGK